jgi:hypothetical protein
MPSEADIMLVLPILVSAVAVFLVSGFLHMATPWHHSDFKKLPNEDAVADALRPVAPPPGDYLLPTPPSGRAEARASHFVEKHRRGPVMMFTVLPSGAVSMGRPLALWFTYVLAVSALAALMAAPVVHGFEERAILHLTSLAAFLAYAAALWQQTIWFRRSWVTALKSTLDALMYGLITGCVFVWLWPR